MYNILKKYKLLSLHVMVLILGHFGIFGKLISLSALHLVWYRMLIAFIALFIFLTFKDLLNISINDFLRILGVGGLVIYSLAMLLSIYQGIKCFDCCCLFSYVFFIFCNNRTYFFQEKVASL